MDTSVSEEDAKKAAAAFASGDARRDREGHRRERHADARSPQDPRTITTRNRAWSKASTKSPRIWATASTSRSTISATRSCSISASTIRPRSSSRTAAKTATYRKVRRQVDVRRQADGFDQRPGVDRQAARSGGDEVRRHRIHHAGDRDDRGFERRQANRESADRARPATTSSRGAKAKPSLYELEPSAGQGSARSRSRRKAAANRRHARKKK